MPFTGANVLILPRPLWGVKIRDIMKAVGFSESATPQTRRASRICLRVIHREPTDPRSLATAMFEFGVRLEKGTLVCSNRVARPGTQKPLEVEGSVDHCTFSQPRSTGLDARGGSRCLTCVSFARTNRSPDRRHQDSGCPRRCTFRRARAWSIATQALLH